MSELDELKIELAAAEAKAETRASALVWAWAETGSWAETRAEGWAWVEAGFEVKRIKVEIAELELDDD